MAIYPFRISRQTEERCPIFYHPDHNTMRSIALKKPKNYNQAWLQRPVEPLFNIAEDGTILARTSDSPTAREIELVDEILSRFEAATSSAAHLVD